MVGDTFLVAFPGPFLAWAALAAFLVTFLGPFLAWAALVVFLVASVTFLAASVTSLELPLVAFQAERIPDSSLAAQFDPAQLSCLFQERKAPQPQILLLLPLFSFSSSFSFHYYCCCLSDVQLLLIQRRQSSFSSFLSNRRCRYHLSQSKRGEKKWYRSLNRRRRRRLTLQCIRNSTATHSSSSRLRQPCSSSCHSLFYRSF